MWISYSDSEINVFHPVCERALVRALKLLGKEERYRVLHHQYTGALEMDFAVQNVLTGLKPWMWMSSQREDRKSTRLNSSHR